MRTQFLMGAAVAALIIPVAASAQETTSSIRGDVVADGAPVAGAQVTVTHTPSGTTTTTTTGADGSFSAAGLRVGGPFTVSADAGGRTANVTDIFLTAGQPFRMTLDVAQAAEIVVTGFAAGRETSLGPITSLNREAIEGVASVSRDIRDLARRDPFATMDQSNSRAIEIAGQNGRLNRFSVDGVQFSDDFGLNNGGLPTARGPVPLDAIEQFSVKAAPFDIEEGDFQGGAINVVLRSGNNDIHGSAFYTYLDDEMVGGQISGNTVNLGDFNSRQYGAFISGPIIKDRLFLAVAYEKLKEGDPVDEGPSGLGFASSIPRVDAGVIDSITATADSVYGYDTLGVLRVAQEKDEKLTAKLDWNITDNHRASLTYIRNIGSNQFTQNMGVQDTGPTFGFASNAYELIEEVNSGAFQLNSTWSDAFSTELRVAYRDVNRSQQSLGDDSYSQFQVCLDPTSVGSTTSCSGSNAAGARPSVFFGPDVSRQANVLNTQNLSADFKATVQAGDHSIKLLAGYSDTEAFNLFLQRASGDIYFDSTADFTARRASRVRLGGAVPSGDINDAAATFSSEMFTFGIQDELEISPTLRIAVGGRYDLYESGDFPALNPFFVSRYGFGNRSTYKGRGVFQPRAGFDWEASERLIFRGGLGLFAGGTPDVVLSNSFSNTGTLTNAIDISRTTTPQGCSATVGATLSEQQAFCAAVLNNVTGNGFPTALYNYLQTNVGSLSLAPTNAIDPDLDLPSQIRATLSANYQADLGWFGDKWFFGADLLLGKAYRGVTYVDLRSVQTGTLPDGRPRYSAAVAGGTNQDLLYTNDNRGRSLIAVARIEKGWDFGLNLGASYTYQDIKDVNPVTSSTAGSSYGNAAFSDPNAAAYGTSIYQIKNQWKFNVDYNHAFFGDYNTRFSVFGEYRTGRPFSYTFATETSGRSTVFGTLGTGNTGNSPSGRYLIYVPTGPSDPLVTYDSPATAAALDEFINNSALKDYRGKIAPKNIGRSPDYFRVDLHVDQELPVPLWNSARFKLFADVENFLNLLDSDWGVQRQVAFPYFSPLTAVTCAATSGPNCTQYRYTGFSAPQYAVQNQNRQSLYQIRVGARFEF